MTITYRKLAQLINERLTEEQKDCDVTIFDAKSDEYFAAIGLIPNWDTAGVLDYSHPIISVWTE